LSQTITIVNGAKYAVNYRVSNRSAGSVRAVIDDVEGESHTESDGVYTDVITAASSSGDVDIRASSTFVGDIDNVSVKRVDTRVTHKLLFRTEGWDKANATSARTFYLAGTIEGEATRWEDNLADDDLDFSQTITYFRIPNEAEHIIESNNRVWFGNMTVRTRGYFDPIVWTAPYGINQTGIGGGVYVDADVPGNLWNQADADGGTITNGVFSADTDWTKGTGWTISAGKAVCDGSQVADSDLTQTIAITEGQAYLVTFDLFAWTAGNITPVLGETEGTDRNTTATTYSEVIVAGSGGDIDMRADADFDGTIDNVVVQATSSNWREILSMDVYLC
jgi:hypothetical protein